jgi:CubicO group peptidase (beta-lactamase class C family)
VSTTFAAAWMLAFMASLALAQEAAQQSSPPPRQLRGRAVEGMIESTGDASLHQFIDTHLAPKYRDSFATPDKLLEHLRAIREACVGFGGVLVDPVGSDGLLIKFMQDGGEAAVMMRIDADPPHQIAALDLQEGEARAQGPEVAPITWENLTARLDEEAAKGFTGTVIITRGGNVVLHHGYGLGNRERNIPNGTETIFAIGSVPIDFTRGAILKLEEQGKLRTADPITKYLDGVPADKKAMTIEHLMTGASGLPDFHHLAGVDADPDLSWIDRQTAIERILGASLLFPPGEGDAHSHSAWVLLAAIVEIVSKQSYADFLRQHFFEPAGMMRTGNHEACERFSDEDFAVGYEGKSVGKLNIPKYWGRTSWLVMGSGGMQSTPMDLYRWNQSIRSGKTLSAEAAKKYWHGGVLAGGDDRGFFCLYNEGPGDMFILCSNAHRGPGDQASAVGRRLAEMVMGK